MKTQNREDDKTGHRTDNSNDKLTDITTRCLQLTLDGQQNKAGCVLGETGERNSAYSSAEKRK
jgi:hypothetical protein